MLARSAYVVRGCSLPLIEGVPQVLFLMESEVCYVVMRARRGHEMVREASLALDYTGKARLSIFGG